MIFGTEVFYALKVETVFPKKSLGSLLVGFQPAATSLNYAKAYRRQLLWELYNPNYLVGKPVKLRTLGCRHPLAITLNLMSLYGLSLSDWLMHLISQAPYLLDYPIGESDLVALAP
jgi:hypothetical protein